MNFTHSANMNNKKRGNESNENQGAVNRRDLLKGAAVAGLGIAAPIVHGTRAVLRGQEKNPTTLQTSEDGVPPHQPLDLPGLHAYAEKSISAGDTIHFRVSSTLAYRLKVCRLAGGVDDLDADVVLHAFPPSQPSPQPIHPGSYIHVASGLTVDSPIKTLSLECWVRPWHVGGYQGLITQYDYPNSGGIGLFLSPGGTVELYLGDDGEYNRERGMTGPKLPVKKWSHIVASWDGDTATIWLNGKRAATSQLKGPVRPGRCPLRLGAYGHNGLAANFLNGDLAMPAIYGRVLSDQEIIARFEAKALKTPSKNGLIACWPLSEEDGDQVADIGPQKRGGRIINHATWMIGGPSFDGSKVGRFDKSYDPTKDKNRGHAVRFASDDLYDCRWQTTHTFKIPEDAKSGIYAGRINYSVGDQPREYHVTFIVRKSKERPKAPILVLCSTNTWMAYNSAPFPVPVQGRPFINTGGLKNSVPEAPAYSMYRNHHPGQPTYYMGLNMPWPNAGPTVLYSPPNVGYNRLFPGSVRTQDFRLTNRGQGYELYDMSADPGQEKNVAKKHPGLFQDLCREYEAWYRDVTSTGVDAPALPIGFSNTEVVALQAEDSKLSNGLEFSKKIGWAHDTVTNWMSTEESVAWDLDVLHSGSYEITLMYACAPSDTGARIELEIGDQQVSSRLEKAHDPQPPTPREANHKRVETQGPVWVRRHAPLSFPTVTLRKGTTRLIVRATEIPGKQALTLKEARVRLLP